MQTNFGPSFPIKPPLSIGPLDPPGRPGGLGKIFPRQGIERVGHVRDNPDAVLAAVGFTFLDGCNMGAAGKFTCDQCLKSYSWKPELAGRRVKCKCGPPLSVPKDDPAAAADALPPEFEDLYALSAGAPADDAVPPP